MEIAGAGTDRGPTTLLEGTPGRTGGPQAESLQPQRHLQALPEQQWLLAAQRWPRLGTRFRFRLKPSGASLRLEPLDPQQRAPLLVGQAAIPARLDPNRFVALQLEPSWALLGTPGVAGTPVEPPVLRASRPDEPAANAGQQCPDPAGGKSLSPLRTNHHSAS